MHCKVTTHDIFYRNEQKLVDSMLLIDLMFSAFHDKQIVIVSSDEDFTPGIVFATQLGTMVYHVKPKTPSNYSPRYMAHLQSNYTELHIWRQP
ncbi:MAG: NYN domain-containing protein [Candidatus Hydrogenedentes bacterium]|nr:NYN domain-containing protein [Candidatus Hydrogenedentota bacterium]